MPATCRSIRNTSVTGSLLKISHNRIVALQLDLVKVIRWCWGQKIFWFLWYTDCFAFRALAILKHLKSAHFLRKMATFRCLRVNKSCFFILAWKSMTFWPWYHHHKILMSKDALRIVSYFVLPQSYPIFAYREACAPLLCSYRGGSLSHKTTPVQAHRGFRLLTLASS